MPDATHATQAPTSFNNILAEDGHSLDDTVLLTHIPERMGMDIAFLASYPPGRLQPRQHKLVVGQLKNRIETALIEVVMTLAPGCQFLTDAQRRVKNMGGVTSQS